MARRQRAAGNELHDSWRYRLQPAPRRCHFRKKNIKWGEKKTPQMEKLFAWHWKFFLLHEPWHVLHYKRQAGETEGGEEKGNWRKNKFSVNLLFTCCLRTGCLTKEVGCLHRQWQDGAIRSTPRTLFPRNVKKKDGGFS